jgi:hypothetical protein
VPERSARPLLLTWAVLLGTLVAALGLLPAPVAAAPYPPLPLGDGAILLGNLTAPTLAPGASGSISFSIVDPLRAPLVGTVATFDVYAFNAFPGNATSTVPVSGAPVLSNASATGPTVTVPVGPLAVGARFSGSIGVSTAATTPVGAFAVRTEVTFTANGTPYRLASRGWFTTAQWASATELPNGSATLNLTTLGVSGVVPETGIVIAGSAFPWVLGAVAAVGIGFVGLGAWFYFRRESSSRAGTGRAGPDQ